MQSYKILFVMFLVFGLMGMIRDNDPTTNDLFFMHVNVVNDGDDDLDNLMVRVVFYDLGIFLQTNSFDLDNGDSDGKLLDKLKLSLTIPGILLIDTPGHAAFTNLRKRGGNLADIAILVIDINEGIMPQTLECIEILKQYKTPFIIALNKIDLMRGWQSKDKFLIQNIQSQSETIQKFLDTKLYELVGKLSEIGFNAERFDRVEDYTKQIAMVPTSATTGEGIPELLMVLTGLAQKYMEQKLNINIKGNAKGTILEVKEDKGIGKTIDVIIYDGTIEQNDTIVVGTVLEPLVTKVKALLEPLPLTDLRNNKTKFTHVKKADFSLAKLKKFIETLDNNKITLIIETSNKDHNNKNCNEEKIKNDYKNKKCTEIINAEINPYFNSEKEIIIRKSDFIDERTFAINADKAAFELNRIFIEKLMNPEQRIEVVISPYC